MAVTLRMTVRPLLITFSVIFVLAFMSVPVQADHIDSYEAQHLLQWDQRRQFFDSWLSAKQGHSTSSRSKSDNSQPQRTEADNGDAIFRSLLEGHSDASGPYRTARAIPANVLTLDQINQRWLQQAIQAYQRRDWLDTQHALSQLSQPVSPAISLDALLLGQATSVRLGHSSLTFQSIPQGPEAKTSRLTDLIQYNQALSLINRDKHSQALPILEQLEVRLSPDDRSGQDNKPAQQDDNLRDRVRLLKAYALANSELSEQALSILLTFDADHPLTALKHPIAARVLLNNGDALAATHLLLKLSNQSPQQISASNIQLLDQLRQLGAETQASLIASQWLLPMQQHYISLRDQAQQVTAKTFLNQLGQRRSGDAPTKLIKLFSKNAHLLLTEIERTNTLLQQIRGQLALMQRQTKQFNRGYPHLKAQLNKHRDLVPSGTVLPAAIIKGDPKIRQLESRLSQLVGQPQPWEQRYILLDGLAIWHTGKSFINRWWQQSSDDPSAPPVTIDFTAATQELAGYHAEQISKTALLEEIRIEEELPRLPSIEQRMKAMQYQLSNQKQLLLNALADSMQLEAQQVVKQVEQDLLWLSTQIAPRPHQFDQPQQQRWYEPQQAVTDSQSVGTEATHDSTANRLPENTKIPYELALSALQALADNALNPSVQNQATHHLADLKLLISERILNGDPIPPRADISPAKAISLYQQLLDRQDPAINRPQVLYQLAKAYELEGLPQQTLAALQQLNQEGPAPELQTEITFRIAELQFSQRHYDLAALSYQQVLDNTAGEYQDQARYKLAWSIFKQGEYASALNDFFMLVDRHWQPAVPADQAAATATAPPKTTQTNQSLLDDTLRVIALTFAYLDGSRSLQQHFDQIGPKPYEAKIYQNLGAYFEYKHRWHDAAETFNALVERFPTDDAAPFYQSRVVAAYSSGGFPSKAWPAREYFVERFGLQSQAWQLASAAQRDRIRPYLSGYLVELAQRDHALAQQPTNLSGTDADPQAAQARHYQRALAWYDQFSTVMPDDPRLPEMLFMKAEALTETDQLPQAATVYKQITYQHPEYARSDEAGYAALLAYQSLYKQAPPDSPAAERWLEKGIEESLLFSTTYPQSKYNAKVRIKVAEDLYIQGESQRAAEAAGYLLQQNRALEESILRRLWRVIGHAQFDTAQFSKAEQSYRRLLALPLDKGEQQRIRRRLSESIYKQGEQAHQAGELIAALSHFQRLGRLMPDAHILPQAKFDAATLLLQMERWPEAVTALERFRRVHPSHKLQATIDEKLVIAYEQTTNWSEAARALQRIFEREGNTELGRDALWRSAALEEKANQPKLAIKGYQRFIETFPSPYEPAMEARLKLYQLAQQQGNDAAQQRWLQAIIAVEKQAGAASTDRTLTIASDAGLILGKQALSQFLLQPLDLPLDKSLPRKQKAMERSVGYLTQVTHFGLSTQSTEATAALGRLYREFARALMDSERPKQLNALELEQYEILLEDQALPFEDKAIDLHLINLGQIAQGIYTPSIETSLNELRQMMPARYNKNERLPEFSDAIQ